MEYIDRKKRIVLISILLIFLFIILYIAIKGYGRIENLATGRAEIFNIGDGEKKDNNIIVEFNIDYEKVDFDKAKAKLNFQTSSINEERKLSNIEKKMKDLGAKEK